MRACAALLVVLAACADDEPDPLRGETPPERPGVLEADVPPSADWTTIGTGIIYQQVNAGHAVLIAYGGYTAKLAYSAAWATELVDAKLGATDVGYIYAVKGPMEPGYDSREIQNSKLRAHLNALAGATGPIYVVAHSSGAFVAHELLAQADAAGDTALLARISYSDLDGGGSGLTSTIVGELGAATFVYARDPSLASGKSQNASTAIALAQNYAAQGATLFEVTVPGTGCNSGAGWCLHDVVITHRPHDPTTYDLEHDYTDFVNRPATIEYLAP